MDPARLVESLNKYGVLVRTRHHLQIPIGKRKYHDIWINDRGEIKIRMYGLGRAVATTLEDIDRRLEGYKYDSTEQSSMEVATLLRRSERICGVFVDAGYKDGRGRIAVIRRRGTEIDVRVRDIEGLSGPGEAEERAYLLGRELWPLEQLFTDSKNVALKYGATWIPRKLNREADHCSNLRR